MPLSDRNVGNAGAAALQSGVQLLVSLGTRGSEGVPETTFDPDVDQVSPRRTQISCPDESRRKVKNSLTNSLACERQQNSNDKGIR